MTITDIDRINHLNDVVKRRGIPDLFEFGIHRFDILRRHNEVVSSEPGRTPSGAGTETDRIAQDVIRSRNPSLKKFRDYMSMGAWADSDSAGSYQNDEKLANPMAFLLLSQHGTQLRDLLIDKPGVANDVLMRLDQASYSKAHTNGFNQDLMVRQPISIMLDKRGEILDRVLKTGGFAKLIQKQEKLLQRVGTTTDICLGSNFHIGNQVFHALPSIEMFKSHWANHVSAIGQIAQTTQFMHPALLTFMLYETLFATCNPKSL
ncbi:MAG: hypothetical protein JRC86_03195, partial [Deltaproteobacteria bacterium]|nr:hypothetical protein [Deltaproteobacteria bacterium]